LHRSGANNETLGAVNHGKSLEECDLRSETDTARDLQKSRKVILVGDLAFSGITYREVGRYKSKLHAVEEVERFHSKIKRGPLQVEFLEH